MAATVGASTARSRATNVAVTPRNVLAWQEPSLAVDPRNSQRLAIAYEEGGPFESPLCGLALSDDGGLTWRSSILVAKRGLEAHFHLPAGFSLCSYAQVLYGPDGTLYYGYLGFPPAFPTQYPFLIVSRDGGRTFTRPQNVDRTFPIRACPAGTPGCDAAPDPYVGMAVDPVSGRLYVTFTRDLNKPNPPSNAALTGIYTVSSPDHGRHFSRAVRVTPRGIVGRDGAWTAVDPHGNVYVSLLADSRWRHGCGNNTYTCPGRVMVAVSRDHARHFSLGTLDRSYDIGCPGATACDLLHTEGYASFVAIGAAARGVFVAWWGGDPQKPSRVFLSRSLNGGRQWSRPRVVGALPGHPHDNQYKPALSVAPDGRIDIVYYDTSSPTNPAPQNTYWIFSRDNGTGFSRPRKLSTRTSNTGIGHISFGSVSFGQFLGVASTNARMFAAWTDTRRGNTANGKQDVFFAAVRIP